MGPYPPPPARLPFEDGFDFMDRRRSSIAGEGPEMFCGRKGTDEGFDFPEFRRGRMPRRVSIIPLDPNDDLDKDGFRRPREFRSAEKDPAVDSQETTKEASGKEVDQEQRSGRKESNFRVSLPMPNMALSPMQPPIPISIPMQDYQQDPYGRPQYPPQPVYYEWRDPAEPAYFNSPFMQQQQPSPGFRQIPRPPSDPINMMMGVGGQEEFRLDAGEATLNNSVPITQQPGWKQSTPSVAAGEAKVQMPAQVLPPVEAGPERKIGTLTVSERREKILKYLEKRKRRIWKKKISYDCRKKVADKRLRIKGRFVTREQAYTILGTTAEDLTKNELLRTLVNSNSNCSIITSAQNMKIRNIQTLFTSADKEKKKGELAKDLKDPKGPLQEPSKLPLPEKVELRSLLPNNEGNEIKVEILKENEREQTVEIKIETIKKGTFPRKSVGDRRERHRR